MNMTELIDQLLAESKTTDCIVIVTKSQDSNIRWANTTLTTNGSADQTYIAIFAINDGRIGSVITSLDKHTDSIKLLRNAESKTALTPKAFDAMPLVGGDGKWPNNAISFAMSNGEETSIYSQLEKCFGTTRSKAMALFGYSDFKKSSCWLANSKGLRKFAEHKESLAELNLKTPDFKKSVWAGMSAQLPTGLDLGTLFKRLERKMAWSENIINLPSGKYETVLEPSAVADFLIYSYWTGIARTADEGQTVFSRPNGKNAIGEQLYSKEISIYSDPAAKNMDLPDFEIAYATSAEQSIFDNGFDLSRTDWIKNGMQQALITPRYWAKKQKSAVNPYIGNLIFDHPDGPNVEQMIATTKRGLLVTCLWYMREVDPQNLLMTGLTRDGVFLIENGKVLGAVNNFRFNMSPVDVLKQATEIGASQPALAREWGDYFTYATMPPLRIKDFNMSTVSDAI